MSGISRFGARNQVPTSSQLNFVGSRGRNAGISSFGAKPESVQSAKNVQQAAQNIKTSSPVSATSTTIGTRIDVKA